MKKSNYHIFFILIGVYLLLQMPLIDVVPVIMIDEPWYANTAWNFSVGNGFTNTVPGSKTTAGTELFLYTFFLGTAFNLFGTSLYTAKMVSIIGGLIALIGFINVLKELRINNRIIVIVSGLLFIFSNVNYIVFRTVRPESWVVCFAIWALCFLLKGTGYIYHYLIAGLLTGLAFLCHPHGAFYVLLFGFYILYKSYQNNNFKIIFLFLTGYIFTLFPLLYNIYFVREESLFQFLRILLGSSSNNYLGLIKNSFSTYSIFFENYTLGIKRLYIFFIEMGVLVIGLFYFNKNKNLFILSLMGLLYFFLFLISPAHGSRHFVQVLIFSFIVIAMILNYYESNKRVFKVIIIFVLLYLGNNLAGDAYIIWRDHNKTSYNKLADSIDKIVPDETSVLTLLNFWFSLKNNKNYNDYTKWGSTEYKSLSNLLGSGVTDYVVISNYMVKGETPTSGRKDSEGNIRKNKKFYEKVHRYAEENGEILETIRTNGYGDIEIWKIINRK